MLPVFISFASSFLLVPCFTRAAQRYTSPMKPELEEHSFKAGTPSSGSFAILIAVLFSALFMKSSPYRGVYVLAALLFSAVGISDDVLKVVRKSSDGLKSLTKLFFQIAASAVFFPIIITAWIIERASITWEEEGPRNAAKQIVNSLFVAIFTYAVVNSEYIRHIMFAFNEWNIVILFIVMLLGTYTGYRLTELKRFAPLIKDK